MPRKAKKHQILGGIKVSSKQLSEWGKSGGRPKKWTNEAERKRAERLRKKQEKFGGKVELRAYRNYDEDKTFNFSLNMVCNLCQAESIGGPQHLGTQCFRCYQGRMAKDLVRKRKNIG